jgi:hypothetical protein
VETKARAAVPLPATIPVRFTEEEADYVSIRPVRRQTFQLRELIDMILRITGRDLARVRQILRSGTVVFHAYRYWWSGFDADATELAQLLDEFPCDDPSRAFQPSICTVILLEGAGSRPPVEVVREAADRKPLFASRSFWDCLLEFAGPPLTYAGYSFERRADLYKSDVAPKKGTALQRDAARLAPRALRGALEALGAPVRLIFVCPRNS